MVMENKNFADDLLRLALDVGEGMLKNGGEINRIEDTVERICFAYGAEHVEVFTIISVINASIQMKDGSRSSQMRRVKSTGMDLSVLEALNALSREVCRDVPGLDYFDEKLHQIKKTKAYPPIVIMFAWALAAASFSVFFGGGILECFGAALAGVAMFLIDTYAPRRMNTIAKHVLSSFAATVLAGLLATFAGGDGGVVIMGSLMLLVPGVAIGTAMRDVFCGDILAGTLKLLQACLSALMLAFGYMLAIWIMGGVSI